MITMVVDHWVIPERLEEAKKVFKTNSDAMRKADGCVSRHVLISQKDPLKYTTVTSWASQEALGAWRQSPNRPQFDPEHIKTLLSGEEIEFYNDKSL